MNKDYDADYFLHGKETGKSLYENYRWIPELTKPMVCAMISHLGIAPSDTILDFGCARGYMVRAFCEMGYDAWGVDCSAWALNNCDETIGCRLWPCTDAKYDWVIAKDVLEHVEEIVPTVHMFRRIARKGIFAVVPLAHGKKYDVPEYELDVTHFHRQSLTWWMGLFNSPGWSTEGRYKVSGVKDNYSSFATGNGFVTARRIED